MTKIYKYYVDSYLWENSMSRLCSYLNELSSEYGKGITFIDIDESIFRTFAKIYVVNDKTGKVVEKLTNQEYNTYELPSGHHFEYQEFRSAKMFRETSIPIEKTIKRIKRMFQNIDHRGSKVVLLTARGLFDDMQEFRQTFRDYGIPIDQIDVELAGEKKSKSVSKAKKQIVMDYLKSGEYRRVRLIDDDLTNLKKFLQIKKEIPQNIIDKVKKRHRIPDGEDFPVIQFYALLVQPNGSLKQIGG